MRQSRDEGQEDVLSLHDDASKRGTNQIFRKRANFACLQSKCGETALFAVFELF